MTIMNLNYFEMLLQAQLAILGVAVFSLLFFVVVLLISHFWRFLINADFDKIKFLSLYHIGKLMTFLRPVYWGYISLVFGILLCNFLSFSPLEFLLPLAHCVGPSDDIGVTRGLIRGDVIATIYEAVPEGYQILEHIPVFKEMGYNDMILHRPDDTWAYRGVCLYDKPLLEVIFWDHPEGQEYPEIYVRPKSPDPLDPPVSIYEYIKDKDLKDVLLNNDHKDQKADSGDALLIFAFLAGAMVRDILNMNMNIIGR